MDNINIAIQNLGLNDKEAKIYLALLELGSGTIQEVAQKSGIKRTNIYNFIGPLKEKGIISEVKEGTTILLVPENPNLLVKRAEENYKEIKTALPELMGIFNAPGNKPKVRFYEGIEGLKKTWTDLFETKENTGKMYGFSDYEKMQETFLTKFPWDLAEMRVGKKIFFYCVAKDGIKGREVKRKDKSQMRETRLVRNLQLDTEINIFGNKVAMLSFRRPYSAVIIEDSAIALSMKSIWQGWWDKI